MLEPLPRQRNQLTCLAVCKIILTYFPANGKNKCSKIGGKDEKRRNQDMERSRRMGSRGYQPRKKEDKEMVYCMDFDLGSIVRVQPNMDIYIGGETSETNYTECRAGGYILQIPPQAFREQTKRGKNVYSRVANTSKKRRIYEFFPYVAAEELKVPLEILEKRNQEYEKAIETINLLNLNEKGLKGRRKNFILENIHNLDYLEIDGIFRTLREFLTENKEIFN